MDPVSAIGLASSILTFVDFATKLVRGTYEAYKTGAVGDNSDAKTVLQDLQAVSEELHHGAFHDARGHLKELLKLADKCLDLSKELEGLLKKLVRSAKDENPLWSSLRLSWLSLRKQKQVQDLERRLDQYRSQIILRLSLLMFAQHSSLKDQLDKIQKQSVELSTSSAGQLADIRQTLERLLEEFKGGNSPKPPADSSHANLQTIAAVLDDIRLQTKKIPRQNRILARLYFPSIYSREDAVEDPEPGTFDWLIEDSDRGLSSDDEEKDANLSYDQGSYRRNMVSSLSSFLKSEHGVYFICGKAGSGKSTLAKFLAESGFAKNHLAAWSHDKKLVLVHVYFWASGDGLQTSREGFLRAILFQTLRQCPELIQSIFPSKWEHTESPVFNAAPFRIKELLDAFKRLKATSQFSQYRFCFFIDGLDEYKGDSLDHLELAIGLKAWATAENVKIVCTARPHSEFLDTFDDPDRTVFLHHLNQGDIALYARSKLSEALEKNSKWNATTDPTWFMDSVARMADGVFLWARLVVRSLLSGAAQYESPEALKQRLEHTPKDLDTLFDKILEQVDPVLQKKSQLVLSIASNDPYDKVKLNALAYIWIDNLQNPDFPYREEPPRLSAADINDTYQHVRHQLDALTKGLLELVEVKDTNWRQYSVGFFHRSARDYVRDRQRQSSGGLQLPKPELYYRLQLAVSKAVIDVAAADAMSSGSWWGTRQETFQWLCSQNAVLPAQHIESFLQATEDFLGSVLEQAPQGGNNGSLVFETWICVSTDYADICYDTEHTPACRKARCTFYHFAANWKQSLYTRRCVEKAASTSEITNKELNPLVKGFYNGEAAEQTLLLLQKGSSPHEPIRIRRCISGIRPSLMETFTTSTWMVLLRLLGIWVMSGTRQAASNLAEILEHHLQAGADANVVFLIRRRRIHSDESGFVTFSPVEDGAIVYCMGLRDLLCLRERMSFEKVIRMLDAWAEPGLWVRVASLMSGLAFQAAPVLDRVTAVRAEHAAITPERLIGQLFEVYGVVSNTDELIGPFGVRAC